MFNYTARRRGCRVAAKWTVLAALLHFRIAVTPGVILPGRDVLPGGITRSAGAQGVALLPAVLHDEPAARFQHARRIVHDDVKVAVAVLGSDEGA